MRLLHSQDPARSLFLMSDLHVGAAHINYTKLEQELKDAKKRGDRVLINGDVFDLILPKDQKRYSPDALHQKLQGRNDVVNEAVNWAAELLAPLAPKHLLMVGCGNHETAVEKNHSVDPVSLLVDRLKDKCKSSPVQYGGYLGVYAVKRRHPLAPPFRVLYWHGAGGGCSASSAATEVSRKGCWVENIDAFWVGHKHLRMVTQELRYDAATGRQRPVWLLRTGSYFDTYAPPRDGAGRDGNYAQDKLLPAQTTGGLRLVFDGPGGVRAEVVS